MDSAELRLFETSLRQAASRHAGRDLDAAFHALGWPDALLDEPAGAAAALFAVQGELNLSSSALDDVVVNALRLPIAADTAVVLPRLGSYDPAGEVIGDRLTVHGSGTRRILDAADVIVVASQGSGHFAVQLSRDDLDLRVVAGLDPAGGWVDVHADLLLPARLSDRPVAWSAATAAGQLAVAQELAAASRSMLTFARDHAAERIQFGRPIGQFQAVRHRLADSLLAVESADAAVGVGWAEPSPFTAAMAKAIAGRSARTVARHAQQVLAGMGFTSEHAFHRYLKRTMVLDQLMGSSAALSAEIGNRVLASRQLPSMLAL